MNKCIIIGRLTADPEIRATQSNTIVANYTLAVDRQNKNEGQPSADFIECVAFSKGGEFAQKYLSKGTKIAIEGRIQTRNWEDKQGNKRKSTEVVVDRHEFVEGKRDNSSYSAQDAISGAFDVPDISDDDIGDLPF